jgi:hypothetical protein
MCLAERVGGIGRELPAALRETAFVVSVEQHAIILALNK